MQPVQDLTGGGPVSRTQFQYSLECADPQESQFGLPAGRKLQTLPQLRDVASDQQNGGLRLSLVIDRDTASRLGITPQTIDDTLYDAFGQRQVSTIFTQLNQYHVVLEVEPDFQRNPGYLKDDLRPLDRTARRCRLSAFTHFDRQLRPLAVNHQGQFPGGNALVQPGAQGGSGRCGQGDRTRRARDRTAGEHPGQLSRHALRLSSLRWPANRS